MTEFDAVLKRAFAEAHEPADDGFSVRIGATVARRERMAKLANAAQAIGFTIAAMAVFYALFPLLWNAMQEFLTSFGLGVAHAQSAMSAEAPTVANRAQGVIQSLSVGMTQTLLILAALSGGAVAYRATQD